MEFQSKVKHKSISTEIECASENESHRGRARQLPSCYARLQNSAPASLLANMAGNREATWNDDDNLKETVTLSLPGGLPLTIKIVWR